MHIHIEQFSIKEMHKVLSIKIDIMSSVLKDRESFKLSKMTVVLISFVAT